MVISINYSGGFLLLGLLGDLIFEMDSLLSGVAFLLRMRDGRRLGDSPFYKGRVDAILDWGAGRHMWQSWKGVAKF